MLNILWMIPEYLSCPAHIFYKEYAYERYGGSMQDARTRRRLELMRLIREENHSNQQRIRAREEILYGKSDSYQNENPYMNETGYDYPLTAAEYGGGQSRGSVSSFGIRFLLAAILFGLYFYSKTQGVSVLGLNAAQVETAVEEQGEQLIDFISQFLS